MAKRKVQQPLAHPSTSAAPPLTVHVLDRFSEADLETWNRVSADLDELHAALYFDVQPQRMRRDRELIAALTALGVKPFVFDGWFRIVDYRYTNTPLSAVGSLRGIGGRFNIGQDTDKSITPPFPALYLGDTLQTAYRERYQVGVDPSAVSVGLTPEEMALSKSSSNVRVRGSVERCIDVSDSRSLIAISRVLAKIHLPDSAKRLMRRLKLGPRDVHMITNAAQLSNALQEQNWRARPTQFGIPSVGQQFAELARHAGYEGVAYRSTKNPSGKCLALFSDNIGSDRTYVELLDDSPVSVVHRRLDLNSAEDLMRL